MHPIDDTKLDDRILDGLYDAIAEVFKTGRHQDCYLEMGRGVFMADCRNLEIEFDGTVKVGITYEPETSAKIAGIAWWAGSEPAKLVKAYDPVEQAVFAHILRESDGVTWQIVEPDELFGEVESRLPITGH
jgi:hypothetical protein